LVLAVATAQQPKSLNTRAHEALSQINGKRVTAGLKEISRSGIFAGASWQGIMRESSFHPTLVEMNVQHCFVLTPH